MADARSAVPRQARLAGLGSLYLAVFMDSLGAFMILPLLPFLAMEMGATSFLVGLMSAAYCLMQVVGTVLLGALSDVVGRQRILLLTLSFCSLSLFLFGQAVSIWELILYRCVHGIFASTVGVCEAIIADNTEPEERAAKMSTVMAAFGLGVVFGPGIGGLLSPLGFTNVANVAAILTALNWVWACVQLSGMRPTVVASSEQADVAASNWREVLSLFRTEPHLSVINAMTFLQTLAMGAFLGLSPVYLKDVYHIGAREMGLMFCLAGVTMVVCQTTITGPAVKHLGETVCMFVGSAVRIAVLLCFVLFRWPFMPYISIALLVAAGALLDPCMASQVATMSPEHTRGAVLGVYQALRSLGEFAGPLAAGSTYDFSPDLPFSGAQAAIVLSCLFLALSPRTAAPSAAQIARGEAAGTSALLTPLQEELLAVEVTKSAPHVLERLARVESGVLPVAAVSRRISSSLLRVQVQDEPPPGRSKSAKF